MPVTITGSNTPTAGGVTYGDGATYANTAAGTSGQVLLSNGASAPTWGTAGAATTATNLAGGVAGAVPYQSGAGATGFSAAGTSGQVLTSAGSSSPTWTSQSSLAAGTATSATSATTATNLAGGSNGTIPYQSAAGTTQMLAVGTAGQVLQTNGAGAPTWVTPGGGSLILLQTVTGSGVTEVDVTGYFTSTYSFYKLYFFCTGTSAITPAFRLYINGSLETAANYAYTQQYASSGSALTNQNSSSQFTITQPLSGKHVAFEITFFNPSNTNHRNAIFYDGSSSSDGPDNGSVRGWGNYMGTGSAGQRAITGIRIFGGTGTYTARLYGIKE
jgi:hypothetical protein